MSPAKTLRELAAQLRAKQWVRTVRKDGWVHSQFLYWQSQKGNYDTVTNACPYLRRVVYGFMYRLRNQVLLAGPRIKGHKIPALPSAMLVGAVALASWLFASTAAQVAIFAGTALYLVAGGFMTAHFVEELLAEFAEREDTRRVKKLSEWLSRNGEWGDAPWLLLLLPAVIVCAAVVFVLLVAFLAFYAVLGTFAHIFSRDGLRLSERLVKLVNAHPRKAPWLRPWVAVAVPVLTWSAIESAPVRIILAVTAICMVLGAAGLLASDAIYDRLIKPVKLRAAQRRGEAEARLMELERLRLQSLFSEPYFLEWLKGHNPWADYFRGEYYWIIRDFDLEGSSARNLGEEQLQLLGAQLMAQASLRELRALEWAFVWDMLGKPVRLDQNTPKHFAQPRHGWLTGRVLLPAGTATARFFAGTWEFVKLLGGVVVAGKLAAICPRIDIVDNEPHNTDEPAVAA